MRGSGLISDQQTRCTEQESLLYLIILLSFSGVQLTSRTVVASALVLCCLQAMPKL